MQDIESAVHKIQQGDEQKREELITSQRDFICKFTSFICKSPLNWQNDDELSIALIAFNRAIDTFDVSRKKSFASYAKLLMKNSLIDYFRKQEMLRPLSINNTGPEGEDQSSAETAASLDSYLREAGNRSRAYEIQIFEEALERIGLSLEELVSSSPLHRDTREKIKEAALKISGKPDLVNKLYLDKRFPVKEIQLLTGLKKKTQQKWRQYLLSLVLILTSGEMENLVEYIWGKGGGTDEKS